LLRSHRESVLCGRSSRSSSKYSLAFWRRNCSTCLWDMRSTPMSVACPRHRRVMSPRRSAQEQDRTVLASSMGQVRQSAGFKHAHGNPKPAAPAKCRCNACTLGSVREADPFGQERTSSRSPRCVRAGREAGRMPAARSARPASETAASSSGPFH